MKPVPSDGDDTLTRAPTSRLVGVDVARALALVGMMSVHILPEFDARGGVTLAFVVSAGRSAALFALLAGVGLSLATGGQTPRLRPRRAVAAAVLTRAGLVALIGLVLGTLSPPVAVILTNYGMLFVVALAVLALRPKVLLPLAAVWVVLTPLLSHALRADLPRGPGAQPSLLLLAEPVELIRALALTGYYPVLQWTAYVMVGVAVGRLALSSARTSARLVAVGLTLAVGSRIVSDQLLARGGSPRCARRAHPSWYRPGPRVPRSTGCSWSASSACRPRPPGGGSRWPRPTPPHRSTWPRPSARRSWCSA